MYFKFLLRYALPLAVFLSLLFASLALKALTGVTLNPVIPMIGVLVATAWYAGRGPGVLLALTFEILITITNRMSGTPDSLGNMFARAVLFLLIAIFVSSRRQAEVRLREALQHEVTANRLRLEFLANVSHEIRTPLTTIIGWASMLRTASFPSEEARRGLEAINKSANTLRHVIDDILDTSRITLGTLQLRPEPVQMDQIVIQTLEGLELAVKAKGLKIVTKLQPLTVTADPVRLLQVCWNVLMNAIKFTPNNGKIVVSLHPVADKLQFTVADTGIGIEEAFLPHVFEPFRQSDASDTRSYGGLGLGLSITKKLVELHGGSISVTSSEGKGTTVDVILPTAAATG